MSVDPGMITVSSRDGLPFLEGIFPEYALICDELLDAANPEVLWMKEGFMFIRLTNAEAVYEDTGQRWGTDNVRLMKLARLEI